MITVIPFEPGHLVALAVHPMQPEIVDDAAGRLALGRSLSATGRSFTAVRVADGVPLFCGGATASHEDYVTVWGAAAADAGPAMLAIERRARRFLAMLRERRVDALVRGDFAAGLRWMARLGFGEEARLSAFFPDGCEAVIFRLRGK